MMVNEIKAKARVRVLRQVGKEKWEKMREMGENDFSLSSSDP